MSQSKITIWNIPNNISINNALNRNQGIGVRIELEKNKTKEAPSSSPKSEPPTIVSDQTELPKYRLATCGDMPSFRYRCI
jgi:hypothetical protein